MYDSRSHALRLCIAVGFFAVFVVGSATVEAAPPLKAPWACGESFKVSQAHGTGSHTGKGKWSWDFAMPVGSQLVAPAEGVVREVRQDSTRYGCDSSYAYDANYVVIAFDDGTEVLFLHLEANSVPVEPGERVLPGDPIGEVGMSGWTCGPHLHLQVQKTCDSWWCSSTQASFEHWGDPSSGDEIVSRNCPRREPDSQMASTTDKRDAEESGATGGGEAPACTLR